MSCKKSKKLKKYRKCVGSEMKGFRGSRSDAKKAFREAAQSCKKKLEDIV
jgi:hypothetical protein